MLVAIFVFCGSICQWVLSMKHMRILQVWLHLFSSVLQQILTGTDASVMYSK